jgi:N-acetylneuraminic acid mutarotase
MSAVGGAVYLISGIEIAAAPGKTPPEAGTPVYLKDAYRFRPGAGWEKLPDLPWSALAAPTPAPVTYSPSRVFVLGGVDGRQVGQLPRATALPNDILYFEAEKNRWQLWPEPWPTPVVCLCTVENDSRWIMISGETMAGKRTTAVTAWNLER